MKIHKFGTISFTDSLNLPVFSNFTFGIDNPAEENMTRDAKLKTLMLVSGLRDHFNKVIKLIEADIDRDSTGDSGDFSSPVGESTLSPKEIVLESLTRIMAK